MTVITWKADQMWPVHNPSWPAGRLHTEYNHSDDSYHIKTEFGNSLGSIRSTLLAAAIVETHNRCLDEYEQSKQVHN